MSIPTVGAGQTKYVRRSERRSEGRSKPSRRRSKPSRRKKGEPGQGEQYADAQALKRKDTRTMGLIATRSRGTPAWKQVTVESRLKSTATTPLANTYLVWITGRKIGRRLQGSKMARKVGQPNESCKSDNRHNRVRHVRIRSEDTRGRNADGKPPGVLASISVLARMI